MSAIKPMLEPPCIHSQLERRMEEHLDRKAWQEHSVESDWEAAAFLPYPAARGAGELLGLGFWHPMAAGAAMLGLQWLDQCEIWLSASRRMADHWRGTVRDQQDSFVAGLRDQLHRDMSQPAAHKDQRGAARHVRNRSAAAEVRTAA